MINISFIDSKILNIEIIKQPHCLYFKTSYNEILLLESEVIVNVNPSFAKISL
jgi:hypothetical protein